MGTPRIDRLDYNAIINGAYDFAQRSVGATQTLSAPQYLVHDRWFVNRASSAGGAGSINITAQTDLPPNGFSDGGSARLVCNTINSITNFHAYVQYIEGKFAAPCIGRKCVYQFWAKSNVDRNLNFVIGQGGSTNRRFGYDFVTESGLVWKKYQYEVDFSASGVGTPVLDTNISIELNFQLGQQGQTTGAVNGSWVTNVAPFFVAGKDTFMDNAANQLWFAGHLLRPVTDDQYATVANGGTIEMEHSRFGGDYQGEELACLRYYDQTGIPDNFKGSGKYPIGRMGNHNGAQDFWMPFKVDMRVAPVMVVSTSGLSSGLNDGGTVAENIHEAGFSYRVAPNSSSWSSGLAWTASAEL